MKKYQFISRDISWLSFNARVLQEAANPSVCLKNRIQFLAIHSNNLYEFFSVRVPALKAQIKKAMKNKNIDEAKYTQSVLNDIHAIVTQQQAEFSRIWHIILSLLNKRKIFLLNEKELTQKQIKFIRELYDKEISPNIIPIFAESLQHSTSLWHKNIFLAVVMRSKDNSIKEKYVIIEVPAKAVDRFTLLPSKPGVQEIILLEDIIRYHLPYIFSSFGYDSFEAHLFKVTQDAEIDMDNDLSETYIKRIESGLKKRRKANPTCLLYDMDMDPKLLEYLINWLNITKKDSIIPRGRIRNFSDFQHFPAQLPDSEIHHEPFVHPDLVNQLRVSDVVMQHDILLCPPYHSFNGIIDLLREAAMDVNVVSIKITAYRLAKHSMICNALINAARNGKKVQVVLELKATYDEEANLKWKNKLEEEGVKVFIGVPNLKIHAKMCIIKKLVKKKASYYGFIATGNLNEDTALVYADYFLITSNLQIMKDINKIFKALKAPEINWKQLNSCKLLFVSPINMRQKLILMIEREIANKLNGKKAGIKLHLNALSDEKLIKKLYEASQAGVEIRMIVRSIMCAVPEQKSFKKQISATSIVDEYLEHGRIIVFENDGAEDTYITSADWMIRNMEYRLEVCVRIEDPVIKKQILKILSIKFNDNVKARILDNESTNTYVKTGKNIVRSQLEIYRYLRHLAKDKLTQTNKTRKD